MKRFVLALIFSSMAVTPITHISADEAPTPILTQSQKNLRLQQHLEAPSGEQSQTMTQKRIDRSTGVPTQNTHQYQYKKGAGNGSGQGTQTKKQMGQSK